MVVFYPLEYLAKRSLESVVSDHTRIYSPRAEFDSYVKNKKRKDVVSCVFGKLLDIVKALTLPCRDARKQSPQPLHGFL